jgi:hypothetical protein
LQRLAVTLCVSVVLLRKEHVIKGSVLGGLLVLGLASRCAAEAVEITLAVDNQSLGIPGNKLPARVMLDFTQLLGNASARINPRSLELTMLSEDGSPAGIVPVRFDDPDPRPDSFHHAYLSSNGQKGYLVFQHQVAANPVSRYRLRFEEWTSKSRATPSSPSPQIGDYDILRYAVGAPLSGNFHTKLTVCDWDNDGLLDIVAGDTLGKITFYRRLSKEICDFDTPTLLTTADGKPVQFEGITAPEVADWDGDGDLDLIVADETSQLFIVENTGSRSAPALKKSVALTDRSGSVIKSSVSPVAEMSFFKKDYAPAPTVFDYNGDGKPDLVFGGYITGLIFWYENTASSASDKPILVSRGAIAANDGKVIDVSWSAAPAFGDLDADGLPDMVSGHIAEQKDRFHWVAEPSLFFWKNTGTREHPVWMPRDFGFPSHWDDYPPDVTVPRIADWNGDGLPDILMSGRSEIFYFENVGTAHSPRFEFRQRLTMANGPLLLCPRFNAIAPVFADLDGDGLPDLISGGSGDIPWSKMTSFGNRPEFKPAGYLQADGRKIYHEFVHGDDTTFPFVFDWDSDGLSDLIVGDGDGFITFYKNVGSKTQHRFASGIRLETTNSAPLCVGEPTAATSDDSDSHSGNRSVPAPGDFDGDGKPDLICGNAGGNVFYYRNSGNGKFLPGIQMATNNNRAWTYPVDWDQDGRLDVLLSWGSGRKAIYLNRGADATGNIKFDQIEILTANMVWIPTPRPIAMDWDQDGDVDLIWASSYSLLHFASRDFVERGYAPARVLATENNR